MWGATYISYPFQKTLLVQPMFKNYVGKHPLQNRTNVQIKGGGGAKGLLNNVQKNCTFLKGGHPLVRGALTKQFAEDAASKKGNSPSLATLALSLTGRWKVGLAAPKSNPVPIGRVGRARPRRHCADASLPFSRF